MTLDFRDDQLPERVARKVVNLVAQEMPSDTTGLWRRVERVRWFREALRTLDLARALLLDSAHGEALDLDLTPARTSSSRRGSTARTSPAQLADPRSARAKPWCARKRTTAPRGPVQPASPKR